MDSIEAEESLFVVSDAKLHAGIFKQLSAVVYKVLKIFPVLEEAKPRSKSGIQALCSLHVAIDKAKNLLQHCSECSKLYLAITAETILTKFEKTKCSLEENLRRVVDIVPEATSSQIMEIVGELEGTVLTLDPSEKQAGDEIIMLLQKEKRINSDSNDGIELESFHKVTVKLGITSSRAALSERRALKKLIEKARAQEDKKKEAIIAYLLHLMRKYVKIFRNEVQDDADSQGSNPSSPTVIMMDEHGGNNAHAFERHLSTLGSFNFKPNGLKSSNMAPEELRCPISLQLMYDPVIISSGQTYERVCIEKWFRDGHTTCPKTQQQLSHLGLTPNYCVKGLISSWCEQHGVDVPDRPPESLDLNYWRLALSECESTDSKSLGSANSRHAKDTKVTPFEDNGQTDKPEADPNDAMNFCSNESDEVNELENHERLLAVLSGDGSVSEKCKVVEQIRFLLKDDEEARSYMGGNGLAEVLVQFLKSAVSEGNVHAQEAGAMALFNLAVTNNSNKQRLLSAGLIYLLEKMIQNSETCEAAAALYLNMSCLDEAKTIIGSSKAVPILVQLLQARKPRSDSCKHDVLFTLYNLSSDHQSISFLLTSGIVSALHSVLDDSTKSSAYNWVEKVLAVLINLALNNEGKEEIVSTPELIGSIAGVLDTGEQVEQEQAVSCLYLLCSNDENCSQLVLQEGVIPALVLMSANGSTRGREKAQKLLKMFREQRQRDLSPEREQVHHISHRVEDIGSPPVVTKAKPLSKSRSERIGRAITSIWKYRPSQRPRQ